MSLKSKIYKSIHNPRLILVHLFQYWPFRYISDELYLKIFFRAHQRKKLNLDNPSTFNEKLQWLKIHDRKSDYTMMSDKYLVRKYIKEKIGNDYLIPLLGVWERAEDIDYAKLPQKFVLKCNHDSGSVIICLDKKNFDKKKAQRKLNKALKKQYYWTSREWNYKNIKPRIIAEQYMVDESGNELKDYKFFCFNGIPKFIQVDSGRFINHIRNFYEPDWTFIPVEYGCPNDTNADIPKPEQLSEMKRLASCLSNNIPHVRVDFYISNKKIYFGELTFHHGGGAMRVTPYEYDELWGDYLDLSKLTMKGK